MNKAKWTFLVFAILLLLGAVLTMILYSMGVLDWIWYAIVGMTSNIAALILAIWNLKNRKR